jgi:L-serine dehydratase
MVGGSWASPPTTSASAAPSRRPSRPAWTTRSRRVDLGDDAHPNTAIIELGAGDDTLTIRGASVGGGRVQVTEIDEFPVDLGGDYHTLVLAAHDRPGTIAAISTVFAEDGVNVATMRVDRTGRHKEALMTIEVDAPHLR